VQPTHIIANLSVPDLDRARDFYQGYLGLTAEDMGLDWVTRFRLPGGSSAIQLVTRDATAPVDSVLSVAVGDQVQEAYDEAVRRGYEIVHPLTTEAWGPQRFFVRAPDGNVINIVGHKDPG
jgi:catechol 2,3-dioxygenase-like lactoylglutathione lyase family enzyme